MTSETEHNCEDEPSEEPARVWEVTCGCGFSDKFRDHDDADAVFEAHAKNYGDKRCCEAYKEAIHAYPSGGVTPEETLPEARTADLSDVTGGEVFKG